MSGSTLGRLAVGIVAVLLAGQAGAKVTLESLLGEMTDLEALTRVPDPAFTVKQFSSYDRRSQHPDVLTAEDWFANKDRGHHLRTEERSGATEWVLMDAEGPGAIVRFWSANPDDAGIIRIYLDGAAEPAIELPLSDMLGGRTDPFVPPVAGMRAAGWNSYLPLPYAKHCKVTASQEKFFYHVNYRTYEAGTEVETYSPEIVTRTAAARANVGEALKTPGVLSIEAGKKQLAQEFKARIEPGASVDEKIETGGALYALHVRVEADDVEKALRGGLFEIVFDGQDAPSVIAPLGDFFGTAPGPNRYASLPSGVKEDGMMYSHWVMPFKSSAVLRLTNTTDAAMTVSGNYVVAEYEWSDASMYFHAKWRSENPIPTRPFRDWRFLEATGKGRFVGDMLHVTNPLKEWWGEGDEKIYVDGETFPSHFGTGSEDYFGYAWCSPELFTHAYHNQPRCDGPRNYGQTCVSRFHIIDSIPFTSAFKFDIEVWHSKECEVAMAATSYWYALPGATDDFPAIQPEQLTIITPPPPPDVKIVQGALEGESLKVVECTGGTHMVQKADVWDWSLAGQRWWRHGEAGDTLTLAFPVEKAGRYDVRGVFTKAVDFGIMRLSVNGQAAGGDRDFYNDGVIVTPEESLGVFDLKQGENTFSVEIVGANEKAVLSHMFGLDYLIVKPAP